MQRKKLGRTGLEVSILGFGCGTVGGLMTRGDVRDQARAVARAIDLGINYFDTAAQYGEGASETSLGRALQSVTADIIVATKVKVPDIGTPNVRTGQIGAAVISSLEASLKRLGRDHVDLFQLHNAIATTERKGCLLPEQALEQVVPAMQRLRADGKLRCFGMTGLGDTPAMLRLVDAGVFATAQIPLNLLNPSPLRAVPDGYPAQDYACMLERMMQAGMGGVGIRMMAGGALSGAAIHPLARGTVDPMGSGSSFAADQARAQRFEALVKDGHADSLGHAAIRYVMANEAIATLLVGLSGSEQLEDAARAIAAGPLTAAGLARVAAIQDSFLGEPR